MKNFWILIVCAGLAVAGCRSTSVDTVGPPGEVTVASGDAVPSGTEFRVQLDQALSTANTPGDTFTATLIDQITTPAGEVVVPSGATVHGTVTGVAPATGDAPGAIRVNFERIETGGTTYPLTAEVVETNVAARDGSLIGEETAIGAAAGAALGVILTGDLVGAVVGGALGAGVGTVISLGSSGEGGTLPSGTAMTVEAVEDITMR